MTCQVDVFADDSASEPQVNQRCFSSVLLTAKESMQVCQRTTSTNLPLKAKQFDLEQLRTFRRLRFRSPALV